MGDLKSSTAIFFKAVLFLLILIVSSVALLIDEALWRRAVFILALIWSSARLYYFMFYVIENYVDKEYKFAGIYSFLVYLWSRNSTNTENDPANKS